MPQRIDARARLSGAGGFKAAAVHTPQAAARFSGAGTFKGKITSNVWYADIRFAGLGGVQAKAAFAVPSGDMLFGGEGLLKVNIVIPHTYQIGAVLAGEGTLIAQRPTKPTGRRGDIGLLPEPVPFRRASRKYAVVEGANIVMRLLDVLIDFRASGESTIPFRIATGYLHANAQMLINSGTIGTEMYKVFELARKAGASMDVFSNVMRILQLEKPNYTLGAMVKASGIVFSMVEQSQLVAAMTFTNQEQVVELMRRMTLAFDDVKLTVAELLDGTEYQNVIKLAASVAQHLATTERKLPRLVTYTMPGFLPAPVIAYRIYRDTARWDEIVDLNSVVHPAFLPQEIDVLSEIP